MSSSGSDAAATAPSVGDWSLLPAATSIATHLLQDFVPLVKSISDVGPAICKLIDDVEMAAAGINGVNGVWKKKVAMDVLTLALEGPLSGVISQPEAESIVEIASNLIDSIVGFVKVGFTMTNVEDAVVASADTAKLCCLCFGSKKKKSTGTKKEKKKACRC